MTTRPTVQAGGGHLMVWGAITSAGTVPLRRVQGTVNTDEYCAILQDRLVNVLHEKPGIVFQQDNAPAYKSNRTR